MYFESVAVMELSAACFGIVAEVDEGASFVRIEEWLATLSVVKRTEDPRGACLI